MVSRLPLTCLLEENGYREGLKDQSSQSSDRAATGIEQREGSSWSLTVGRGGG